MDIYTKANIAVFIAYAVGVSVGWLLSDSSKSWSRWWYLAPVIGGLTVGVLLGNIG